MKTSHEGARPRSPMEDAISARLCFSLIISVVLFRNWIFDDIDFNEEKMVDSLATLVFAGLYSNTTIQQLFEE